MTRPLVLASNNPGKLKEFGELLAPIGFDVRPQGEFGVPEAEEPHLTFIENALAKARHAARLTGLPALADDSGICGSSQPRGGPDYSQADSYPDVFGGDERTRQPDWNPLAGFLSLAAGKHRYRGRSLRCRLS